MTKWMLALGAATMALAVPALGAPGGGKGGGSGPPAGHGGGGGNGGGHGNGGGGGGPPAMHGGGQGHGGGNGGGGPAMRGGGGGGFGGGAMVMRGGGGFHGGGHGGGRVARAERPARSHAIHQQRQVAHGRSARAERVAHAAPARQERMRGAMRGSAPAMAVATAAAGAGVLYANANPERNAGLRGPINGCPPGLAAKNNGCLPPGQVKKQWGYGAPLAAAYANEYLPPAYRSWYPDNDRYFYRYGDGYVYQVDRSNNLLSGLFPLDNMGYYAPGDYYPSAYDYYNVPQPYQRYYPDQGDYAYRYGDGAIYQVDRNNGAIDSIVALLTGGGMGIGQRLPAGYDVYNVPDPYRDRYYDTPDSMYRYADGSIYQVDPKTQIIQAIISALV